MDDLAQDMRPVASITVGERHRKEMGDLQGLAESIRRLGLLQPLCITPLGELIAGERRLRAVKLLGWQEVPVRVVDLAGLVRGEMAENFTRKSFTPSEAVAVAEAAARCEEELAKARRVTAPHGYRDGPEEKVKTAEIIAAAAGMKKSTLAKARAVVLAAEEAPEVFGKLREDMDRTGRVDGPFKRLNVIRKAVAIRAETPPLPQFGPYRVIVADPPWPYEVRQDDPSHRAAFPYPTMSIDEICALGVPGIAHEDSILWLWTTNHHMPHAYRVAEGWGYRVVSILTWAKNKIGYGDWLRGQTEHCLMCVRGKPTVQVGAHSTLLVADVTAKHSEKPDAFYDLVEALCPAPRYAELFARRGRAKWDGHGDEMNPMDIEAPHEQA